MARKRLSGPVKAEAASVVAYLERVARQDVDKAKMLAREQEVYGHDSTAAQNHYLTSAQRLRDMAYQIGKGMHRRASPIRSETK